MVFILLQKLTYKIKMNFDLSWIIGIIIIWTDLA